MMSGANIYTCEFIIVDRSDRFIVFGYQRLGCSELLG
jgi:hypothetical protein